MLYSVGPGRGRIRLEPLGPSGARRRHGRRALDAKVETVVQVGVGLGHQRAAPAAADQVHRLLGGWPVAGLGPGETGRSLAC